MPMQLRAWREVRLTLISEIQFAPESLGPTGVSRGDWAVRGEPELNMQNPLVFLCFLAVVGGEYRDCALAGLVEARWTQEVV